MTSTSARGYDDTAELMEMAIGIFDGRFKSVEKIPPAASCRIPHNQTSTVSVASFASRTG